MHNIIILSNTFLRHVQKKYQDNLANLSIITLFECHNYKTNEDVLHSKIMYHVQHDSN